MRRFSTAVTITDPLVKYQTLVKSGIYSPDPAQHRLARHLRDIYLRIKDYSPQVEYKQRLSEVARLTETKIPEDDDAHGILALRNHAIWRNPLFKHLLPASESRDGLALTRVLNSHEMAMEIDSPKGLFLSGEVGTGKSMLLDLLADGLPTHRKRRWHFNTFMLYTVSQLEKHRESHTSAFAAKSEYSIAWMAKKLVDESPILFLDEFQLPDRAASKILSHLFIAFFQLGGILVASSNRMPEELQKATGVDYAPGPTRGFMGKIFGTRGRGELYGPSSDFANFLEVLKARCDFWQMEGAQDWRRKEELDSPGAATSDQAAVLAVATDPNSTANAASTAADGGEARKRPYYYYLLGREDAPWQQSIRNVLSWTGAEAIPWGPSTRVVYGRKVVTPLHHQGHVFWEFDRLVESFGPADYISMASSYHTFIIDKVPVLTVLQKNEARRFITLLDALYEARCKLVIRAASPPDDLFFPETPRRAAKESSKEVGAEETAGDATYSETAAEVYQDQVSPFRPNVSYYDTPSATAKYDPDQDSDFGLQKQQVVDFGRTGAFTGEDERFAYKRATSRLWELCSARWHSRTGDWWQPLPAAARHWEGGAVSKPLGEHVAASSGHTGEGMGESVEVDELAGLAKWRVEHFRKQSG
ncbi:Peroxisome-assembly ATPase [Purpureocillium takamizusanense]|uniref:Peroxisome-assembly ATPase n=1 Tax=Purpureocillium takamizusanense TaxID=2060973 RepID=A0A9Q8QJB0_9HYPO|nr:Peroxisome-assembly ATPase [Purpureocillium takamizusanense]UNI20685.1 Peroxisome-assembly ATPase [Purpureocillium takamizusanense]